MPHLLIATSNPGKKREYEELFADLPLRLFSLRELSIMSAIEETGATFVENALLKAQAYAQESGMLTLADDSGLEVDALGGAPGIRSARYGEPGYSDEDRYRLLLRNIADVPCDKRTARFRCAIALVWPEGHQRIVEGTCEGYIAEGPRGSNGFGYDPVFYIPEYGCTMAELSDEVKNRVSHRADAVAKAAAILASLA